MPKTTFPAIRGLAAKGLEDGRVEVVVVKDGKALATIIIEAKDVAGSAFVMFSAALAAFNAKGKPEHPDPSPLHVVQATTIRIDQHPMPNRCILHVQMGEAHIGFEVPNDLAAQLGQALLDASAQRDQVH